MNASLRDLATRAAAVPPPSLDVSALVAAGESRRRRRRLSAVAGAAAAALAVTAAALLAAPDNHDAAPLPAGPTHTKHAPHVVKKQPGPRLLTYGVGTTIHWGDRTIDVGEQAHGRLVRATGLDYVDATDDGAVFITGPQMHGNILPVDDSAVWFTAGSAPVRIGTTTGNTARGYPISSSASGSTLVWEAPGAAGQGPIVVYDTRQMREVARFGDGNETPLAVYGDVVYWATGDAPCAVQGDYRDCLRPRWVMRFDKASGRQTRVDWAEYEADRRARPGVLTGPFDGDARVRGDVFYDSIGFVRRGDRLVGWSRAVEVSLTVAITGHPLRLRVPSGYRRTGTFEIVQWLDADRVAVFAYVGEGGSEFNDAGDILVCRLSTGACRLAVRGDRRTPYAVPMAD